jgi:hypothetical protein
MALTPNLTPLDRRVLEAVRRPARAASVTWGIYGASRQEFDRVDPARLDEVVAILRGLEHLGLVKRKAGGWWVAT